MFSVLSFSSQILQRLGKSPLTKVIDRIDLPSFKVMIPYDAEIFKPAGHLQVACEGARWLGSKRSEGRYKNALCLLGLQR